MTMNISCAGKDFEGDYPRYSDVNRRNLLSAAGLVVTGSALLDDSSAHSAPLPVTDAQAAGGEVVFHCRSKTRPACAKPLA